MGLILVILVFLGFAIIGIAKRRSKVGSMPKMFDEMTRIISKHLNGVFYDFWKSIDNKEDYIKKFNLAITVDQLFIFYSSLFYVSILPILQNGKSPLRNPVIVGHSMIELSGLLVETYKRDWNGKLEKEDLLRQHGELSKFLAKAWDEYTGEDEMILVHITRKAYSFLESDAYHAVDPSFMLVASVVLSQFTVAVSKYFDSAEEMFRNFFGDNLK